MRRFAETVCPPPLRDDDLADAVLSEFESLLHTLPARLRSSVQIGFVVFDQGARFYPKARGRRFVTLPDSAAEAYVRSLLTRRSRGPAPALQRLKGLVVMCYYELPAVKDQIGYHPDAYITAVSQRRLASYAAQIRAAEAAVLAPLPTTTARTLSAPPAPPGQADGWSQPDPPQAAP